MMHTINSTRAAIIITAPAAVPLQYQHASEIAVDFAIVLAQFLLTRRSYL